MTHRVAEHRPEDVDGNASSAIQSYTNQDLLNLLSLLERCKASSLFRPPKGVAVLHFSFTRLENAAPPMSDIPQVFSRCKGNGWLHDFLRDGLPNASKPWSAV